jgi:hypothetical protein
MNANRAWIATSMSWICAFALISACDAGPPENEQGIPYCWIYDCPTDPGAETCGTCSHPGNDRECTPGYVCSCHSECVKGPRSYDGGVCALADGGVEPPVDANQYVWPECDEAHIPGT